MDPGYIQAAETAVNEFLVWVGFGTIVGLAAKAIMPGRDPGGAVGTLLMGIVGCIIGCGTLMFFWEGNRVTPISPPSGCGTTTDRPTTPPRPRPCSEPALRADPR